MGTNTKDDFSESKEYGVKSEEFEDFSETMLDGSDKKSLEDGSLSDPDNCGMCGGPLVIPRMLHCLHTFCEECLGKKLVGEAGDAGSTDTSIQCPICNYSTLVGTKKLAALPLDVSKTNVTDVSNSPDLHCTSCTAKEMAKSKCNTCQHLLCNNCDKAHHFMRCFESHKVVALEDMVKSGIKITVHKPLVCDFHPGENLIFYCLVCSVTACTECIKVDHKGHQFEGILDSEPRVRQEMEGLVKKGKEKIENLTKASATLNNNMEELSHQRSTARDLINESYQSYKAVLEKCKDDILEELTGLYHERELVLMQESNELGNTIVNLEDACKCTSSLLEGGTAQEMMYLRTALATRLMTLNHKSPKLEKSFSIEFKSDLDKFEYAIRSNFGKFATEEDVIVKTSQSSPVLPELAPLNINGINGINNSPPAIVTNGCSAPSVTTTSPISLPTSMQSSFDGELGNNLQMLMAQSPPLPHVNSNQGFSQGFSSIAEYNIAQLATLAENTNSAATSPTTAPFNIADILNNDTAFKNIATLVKLAENVPNGNNMLARSTSAASLNLSNNLINGFGGVSTSTSPLLSTPDDIIPDPLTNIIPNTGTNTTPSIPRSNKVSPMQIRCKFGQLGPGKGQFNSPHGFCLGLEEDIIVADTNNHRIQIFEKTGTFKFQFGIPGKDEGQLWYPRKVAVMRNTGKYVVCDRGNERSRMQIFTKNGHFLKKIAIRYIDIVAGLAVTVNGEIVAVDSVSPTVFIIGESGDLLRWFDCSDYMREPSDIAIHGKEFYVCDFKGHNVVVFNDDGQFLRRIGCENLTNFPNGIDISDAGDVLIGDSHGNRFHVAVFSRDGGLISEFECPYVKVSRCCGLKITSEGYVVTLAKNNHHVLII
ncbi:brain tumor protein isoform X2 [Diabrotica virgifera virgifera]|uniref:B-box type zinc finger protein ncl-1-like n=1 Tax=Diabrotica virgifera virgifera TaxID=50390 RepID=A0ABM5KMF2_DIAVI|nr:brain tumor protein isoform X2 [Diabrotica virgifera virgifera]